MKAILNLTLIIILLLCAWSGFKKGLIPAIVSLLVLVISLYGANLLSKTYSYEVIDALRPFASGYLETQVNKEVRPQFSIAGTEVGALSVNDYLTAHPEDAQSFCAATFRSIGVSEDIALSLADESLRYSSAQEVTIDEAMVEILCRRLSYIAGVVLAFLLLLIILTVLQNLPNLSFKIPGMDTLNDVGGLVCGAVQGLCFCLLLAFLFKFTGLLLPQEQLADSFLLSWFMKIEPVSSLLGI